MTSLSGNNVYPIKTGLQRPLNTVMSFRYTLSAVVAVEAVAVAEMMD